MGILYGNSIWAFIIVTLFVGGGVTYMTGRAVANTWQSFGKVVFYCLLLAFAARFLHFALYEGALLSLHYLIVNFLLLLAFAALGFRITRANQMATQYSWIYEKSGPLGWREKRQAAN